jgi:hypothetical protein
LRFLRIAAIAVGAFVLLLLGVGVAARMSDGPIAIFAGGPLTSGELVTGAEPDWGFASQISEVEFQLIDPPRSRTTWILEDNGRIYIPCGYMNSTVGRIWKKWPIEAEKDGRAMLRIAGKRYPRQLVRISEAALSDRLTSRIEEKYGVPATEANVESGDLWIFELAPARKSS